MQGHVILAGHVRPPVVGIPHGRARRMDVGRVHCTFMLKWVYVNSRSYLDCHSLQAGAALMNLHRGGYSLLMQDQHWVSVGRGPPCDVIGEFPSLVYG